MCSQEKWAGLKLGVSKEAALSTIYSNLSTAQTQVSIIGNFEVNSSKNIIVDSKKKKKEKEKIQD